MDAAMAVQQHMLSAAQVMLPSIQKVRVVVVQQSCFKPHGCSRGCAAAHAECSTGHVALNSEGACGGCAAQISLNPFIGMKPIGLWLEREQYRVSQNKEARIGKWGV
jgi:hypothetical protein